MFLFYLNAGTYSTGGKDAFCWPCGPLLTSPEGSTSVSMCECVAGKRDVFADSQLLSMACVCGFAFSSCEQFSLCESCSSVSYGNVHKPVCAHPLMPVCLSCFAFFTGFGSTAAQPQACVACKGRNQPFTPAAVQLTAGYLSLHVFDQISKRWRVLWFFEESTMSHTGHVYLHFLNAGCCLSCFPCAC